VFAAVVARVSVGAGVSLGASVSLGGTCVAVSWWVAARMMLRRPWILGSGVDRTQA